MKKMMVILLVLLAALFTSCSISAGFPGLFGGWGFFYEFGNARSDAQPDGSLLLEQNGSKLTGNLTVGETVYEIKGNCFKDNSVTLQIINDDGSITILNGVYANNTISAIESENSNWCAVKEK